MKLNKSKSLYVVILFTLLSVALMDYKRNASNELTYTLGPQQPKPTEMLAASEVRLINQNKKIDETDNSFNGLTIPCK